ncbi:hypothetical protein EDD85DRAFT_960596 [Armillaria nabsnona]|nr:hypothetical protein EDD85DRAFT_960596 [Armillaria nabsnona]
MSKASIFFTGATGYIGGTILSRLIEHKDSKTFDITMLLRPTWAPAGYEAFQPRRNFDLTVIAADDEGYVKTYICSLVSQDRVLVQTSIARKQGGVAGAGKNHWSNVDMNEVADLYLIIEHALSPSSTPAEFERSQFCIYFTVSDEHTLYDLSKAAAEGLARRGIGSPEPYLSARQKRNLYPFHWARTHESTLRKAEARPWDGIRPKGRRICWPLSRLKLTVNKG